MASYTHVVFDFDGVLCDSLPLAICTHNSARQIFPAIPVIANRVEWNNVYNCAEPLAMWLDTATRQRFFDWVVAETLREIEQLRLVEHYLDIVTSIGSAPVYILTAGSERVVQTVLGLHRSNFRAIRGRESARSKHHGLKALIASMRCDRCDVLYIGDTPTDIRMCKELDIDVVGVGYGYGNSDDILEAAPTYYAGSLTELIAVLRSVVRNGNDGVPC